MATNFGKKRGPGRPRNDEGVVRASVIAEPKPNMCPFQVKNKDPNLHYVIASRDNDMEMLLFSSRGYTPATGDEEWVMKGGMDGQADQGPGKPKIRGNRIIMCCPKHLIETREARRLARQERVIEGTEQDARKLSRAGVRVKPLDETDERTVRETIKEEQ